MIAESGRLFVVTALFHHRNRFRGLFSKFRSPQFQSSPAIAKDTKRPSGYVHPFSCCRMTRLKLSPPWMGQFSKETFTHFTRKDQPIKEDSSDTGFKAQREKELKAQSGFIPIGILYSFVQMPFWMQLPPVLGVPKSSIMNVHTIRFPCPRLAIAETHIIKKRREYLESEGSTLTLSSIM